MVVFPGGGGWVPTAGGGGGDGASTFLSTASICFRLLSATVFSLRIDSSIQAMLERLLTASFYNYFSGSSIPVHCFPILLNSSISFFSIWGGYFFAARSRVGVTLITKRIDHSFGNGGRRAGIERRRRIG
jgi:hypothetical protein